MENSLVLADHGLTIEQAIAWFDGNIGEVARCVPMETSGPEATSLLVELVLENEQEMAMHRFTAHHSGASARQLPQPQFCQH
jgi:hypothetical protein